MNVAELTAQLSIAEMDSYVKLVVSKLIEAVSDANPSLKNPTIRLIMSGGKRLRPIFVIAAALSQGGEINDNTIIAAAAVELVHISSLIHDDIIDNSDTRRGSPTINASESVNEAILAGDYMLARGLELAASVSQDASVILAAAFTAMCVGQSEELASRHNLGRTTDEYLASTGNKSAALLAAACKIGALCGGLDSNSVNALNDYGYNFGMAFQIIDDLLDLTSSTEITGKTTQNDIKEGVYTLPLLLGLASDHSTKIKSLLNKQSVSYEMYATLVRVLKDQGAVDQALTITLTYSQLASEALSALDQTCIVKGLIKLPELYLSQSWRK